MYDSELELWEVTILKLIGTIQISLGDGEALLASKRPGFSEKLDIMADLIKVLEKVRTLRKY